MEEIRSAGIGWERELQDQPKIERSGGTSLMLHVPPDIAGLTGGPLVFIECNHDYRRDIRMSVV